MPIRSTSPLLPVLLLAAGLVFSGCSAGRRAAEAPTSGFPHHSVDAIRDALALAQPDSVDAYRAETALSVRSPAQSGSFSADITHRRNDSLLITVSPGFGIIAVRALVTPDSVFVHDRIHRELAYGSIADLGRFLPLPADPAALYSSLLGLIAPDSAIPWELSVVGDYYQLRQPDGRRSFTIDPALWHVVRYEERGPDGTLVEERTFSEFERYTTGYLPRRLTFRRPGDDTAASLYVRKRTINPADLRFDFVVGTSVKRVPL